MFHQLLNTMRVRQIAWAGYSLSIILLTSPLFADEIMLDGVLVQLIDQVELPAREAGPLTSLNVTEGIVVKQGQLIGTLDDEIQKLQVERAQVELGIAEEEARNAAPLQLAEKAVELEQQTAIEQQLKTRIAEQQATNELKVQAAEKQRDVDKNELERLQTARRRVVDAVSDSELEEKRLKYDQSTLNARQSQFEHLIDQMLADAEAAAQRFTELSIEKATLAVSDTRSQQNVAQLKVQLQKSQLSVAEAALRRRQIHAPLDGLVVSLNKSVGEWLEPGESVARIVRLDRLRAEGFLSSDLAAEVRRGQSVRIMIDAHGEMLECGGIISFVSPEIDPINREVRVWAEFDNADGKILPGMHGVVTILTDE